MFDLVVDQSQWAIDAHEYHLGLFAGAHVSCGVRGSTRRGRAYQPSTLPDNVCRTLVDTLQAKIGKHRPLPKALTARGDWKRQRRARKLTQFCEGVFYKQKIFTHYGPMAIRDSGVFGSGYVAVLVHGKTICTERVMPWELFVDERDAEYGSPRNLYRLRRVDMSVLLELYGRTESGGFSTTVKAALEAAKNQRWMHRDQTAQDVSDTTDRVDVLEAWHLCDAIDAHESGDDHKCTGRHVVMVRDHVLVDEEWDWFTFPIAPLRYSEPMVGWHGSGLVEQVEGYQYEINASNEKLSEMHKLSGSLITVPDGGDVVATEVNNDVGTILRCAPGFEPKVHQLDLVSATLSARVPEMVQRAMNSSGISQMAAMSQKPSGINSGIALQTLDDVETERFVIFGRQYESWCLLMAQLYVCAAKQIAAEYGEFAVGVPMRAGLLELSWSDVEIDGYELRIFPTSELSTKPAAQLEKLEAWFNVGLFDGETLLRLNDNPDVQAELELRIADKMVIDDMIERMLDADEDDEEDAYMAPTPYQDYEWAKQRAQQKLNRAVLDGAPEFNQEMLRRFIADCQAELERMHGTPMPAPGAPIEPTAPPVDPAMADPMMSAPPMPPDMPPPPAMAS